MVSVAPAGARTGSRIDAMPGSADAGRCQAFPAITAITITESIRPRRATRAPAQTREPTHRVSRLATPLRQSGAADYVVGSYGNGSGPSNDGALIAGSSLGTLNVTRYFTPGPAALSTVGRFILTS